MSLSGPSYSFVLPKGWVDGNGTVHRQGVMRLATARDELEALRDPTVTDADDPALTLVLLARVITRLGDLDGLDSTQVESMYASDLAHLLDVHAAINYGTQADIDRLTGRATSDVAPLPPPGSHVSLAPPPTPEPAQVATTAAAPEDLETPAAPPPPPDPAEDHPAPSSPPPQAEAPDDQPEPEPTPITSVPKGRRARIQEVGRSTGRP